MWSNAVMTLLLYEVGVVSMDMPGIRMLAKGERERRKETRRGTGMGNSSCVLDTVGGILNTTIVQAHIWGPQLRYVSFWGSVGIKTVSHEFMSKLQFLKRSKKKMLFCSFCRFPLPVDSWDGSFLAWLMGSWWRRPVRTLLMWTVNILLRNCCYMESYKIGGEKLLLPLLVNKQISSLVVTCFWCADITSCVAEEMWGGKRSLLMLSIRDTQSAVKPN